MTLPPDSGGSASCSLGKGDVHATCAAPARGSSRLLQHVESAIDLLVREKPQLVDVGSQSPANTNQYRVLDVDGYLDAVVTNLQRQGLCAERDPDDLGSRRILAKDGNDFSEGFSILTDRGFMQRGALGLRADVRAGIVPRRKDRQTCRPREAAAVGPIAADLALQRQGARARPRVLHDRFHADHRTRQVLLPFGGLHRWPEPVRGPRPKDRWIASPARTGSWAGRRTPVDPARPGRTTPMHCARAARATAPTIPDNQYDVHRVPFREGDSLCRERGLRLDLCRALALLTSALAQRLHACARERDRPDRSSRSSRLPAGPYGGRMRWRQVRDRESK